jgi:hypothetical protein
MANITPTVGWICATPSLVDCIISILEDPQEVSLPIQLENEKSYFGRIKNRHVLVVCPHLHSGIGGVSAMAHTMSDVFPQLQAIFIMSNLNDRPGDSKSGDLFIGPVLSDNIESNSPASESGLHRAINVLRKEVGNQTFWISLNNIYEMVNMYTYRSNSNVISNNQQMDTLHENRLHYLQDFSKIDAGIDLNIMDSSKRE